MKKDNLFEIIYSEESFSRHDESDDSEFYRSERIIDHLDTFALATVEKLVGELVTEEAPVILDLMAGWNSHIPEKIKPAKVVGLGLNRDELEKNEAITEIVIHDVNKEPELPFPDNYFDVVINTVSVDYATKPFELFESVGRILKPGGLFLVIFSNRMFPRKAIKLWRESNEQERLMFVEDLFRYTDAFEDYKVFISMGKPRPKDDKYAHLGIPSDPVFAVYADKKGKDARRKSRPEVAMRYGSKLSKEELARRKDHVKDKLACPYCGEKLSRWQAPECAQTSWNCDFMYVCFNDACPYFVNGFDAMTKQGNMGYSYRFMYVPENDNCSSIPVDGYKSMREGIIA